MANEKCNNPTCEKELVHTEGRRKKKYCSAACKNKINVANYLEKNKGKMKSVKLTIEEYKKLLEQIAENNKPENKERILKERNGIDVTTKNHIQYSMTMEDVIPRLKGESTIDYKIRCAEIKQK